MSVKKFIPSTAPCPRLLMTPGTDPLFETMQKTSFCLGGFLLLSKRAVRTLQLRTAHVPGTLTVSMGQKPGAVLSPASGSPGPQPRSWLLACVLCGLPWLTQLLAGFRSLQLWGGGLQLLEATCPSLVLETPPSLCERTSPGLGSRAPSPVSRSVCEKSQPPSRRGE